MPPNVLSHAIPLSQSWCVDCLGIKLFRGSVLHCPLPGVSAFRLWNQVTCVPHVRLRILCCFCYRQLPGLQGEVRAEQLSGRGWLVLSALNMSRFNPSQQQSTRQSPAHSLPCQPHQGGNWRSRHEKPVA